MGSCSVCLKCGSIFYSVESIPIIECTECGKKEIRLAESFEELVCSQCGHETDIGTQIIHGNLKKIPIGLIKCRYDDFRLQLK